jgi:hypothetical protein
MKLTRTQFEQLFDADYNSYFREILTIEDVENMEFSSETIWEVLGDSRVPF